jgi:hypothetical protein
LCGCMPEVHGFAPKGFKLHPCAHISWAFWHSVYWVGKRPVLMTVCGCSDEFLVALCVSMKCAKMEALLIWSTTSAMSHSFGSQESFSL